MQAQHEQEVKILRGDLEALSQREEEVEKLRGDVTELSQLVEKTNRALEQEQRGHSSQRLQIQVRVVCTHSAGPRYLPIFAYLLKMCPRHLHIFTGLPKV